MDGVGSRSGLVVIPALRSWPAKPAKGFCEALGHTKARRAVLERPERFQEKLHDFSGSKAHQNKDLEQFVDSFET